MPFACSITMRESSARWRCAVRSYVAPVTLSRRSTAVDASSTLPNSIASATRRSPLSSTGHDDNRRGAGKMRLPPRDELDDEVALERVGDVEQRVDPRRAAAAFEPCDRRLGRADELGQLP